jgi:hypothetical protein
MTVLEHYGAVIRNRLDAVEVFPFLGSTTFENLRVWSCDLACTVACYSQFKPRVPRDPRTLTPQLTAIISLPSRLAMPFKSPRLCLRSLRRRLIGIDLLSILVVPDSRGWRTVPSTLSRAHAHDLAVDGARDAVLQLEVHFGNGVVGEDTGVGDVACGVRFVDWDRGIKGRTYE